MTPEPVELGYTNGNAETIPRNRSNRIICEEINGRRENYDVNGGCPCANANSSEGYVSVKSTKGSSHVDFNGPSVHRELTLKDLCHNPDDFEDDEDDSDWEPLLDRLSIKHWSCTNCTLFNIDGVDSCEACNEHKESGILKHGFFASAVSPGDHVEAEVIERYTKSLSDSPAAGCSTAVGFDERMLLHSEVEMKSHLHPERPDRLRAIAASLSTAGIFPGKCRPIAAREITREELQKVHSMENIEAVDLTRQMLSSYFTPDTYANEHSAQAARLAAGLCADLASEIFSGRAKNGFALVRPPGHHAGVHQSMGFCLHNNAAIAALAAQAAGAKKVMILDWDVHHGNGTQEIFDKNKSVLYISLHRHEGGKFYPGTGAAHEVGTLGAEGYCVNVPWSRGGVGDNDYIFAFQHAVLPIALEFAPDFTIISAGFDAARGDPLGGCDVTPAGYACMTHLLSTLAGGKLLVILEGGYNLRSISSSATAVIKVLLGETPDNQFDGVSPTASGMQTLLDVLKIQTNFWPCLGSNLIKLQECWESYLLGKNSFF
ncbi:histone deacetylase 15 isoform X2 [Silene latifolia]|uniref:histone deacetylase 15 isoform X2 n=1 Tax=Silene latifolia TaxID=37657 RepID=UPI003D787426